MGVIQSIDIEAQTVKIEMVLTTGWCPFASRLLEMVEEEVGALETGDNVEVVWGTVNPLEGRKALEQMEVQIVEYGAKAFKFYNVRYDYGKSFPWRMDDPQLAFPIYEKARELRISLIGFPKGVPLRPQPIEATQTWDRDGVAANFPD